MKQCNKHRVDELRMNDSWVLTARAALFLCHLAAERPVHYDSMNFWLETIAVNPYAVKSPLSDSILTRMEYTGGYPRVLAH